MRLEDINWCINEYSGFHTARFDTLIDKYDNKGRQYRSGRSVDIAFWQDGRPSPFMFSGQGKLMCTLSFALWLQGKCQVYYNEYGEY